MPESLSSEIPQQGGSFAFLPAILRELGVEPAAAFPGIQLGELMRNAPTLGAALLDFVTHHHRHAHGGVAYLLTDSDNAFFGYALYRAGVTGYHSICDAAAMAAFRLVCELARPVDAPITEVLLSHSEPPDLEPYRAARGVNIRFNSSQTAGVFPRKLLEQPVAGADAALRKVLEERVRNFWGGGDPDPVTHLRRVLRIALLRGPVSAHDISAQIGLSRRTLHRRLEEQGLRFQDVLDETRHEFARQLLANTQLGIGQIGAIVGFHDRSVFSRGFSRWAGVTPSKWRLSLQSEVPKVKVQGA